MSSTIKGVNDMTLVGKPRTHSKAFGETERWEYRGPTAKALAFYNNAKVDDSIDDVEYAPNGAIASVILTYVDQQLDISESDNAIWEVDANEIFKDLRTHPYFTTVSGLFAEDVAAADKAINDGVYYDASTANFPNPAGRYYELRIAGVEGYFLAVPVLRKSVTVSARSQIGNRYAC